MISKIKIRNFKSLEKVDLEPGYFNILVGANASGKTNFLDALRFLQGLGDKDLSLDSILNGLPASSTRKRWSGIRGGSQFVAFRNRSGSPAEEFGFEVQLSEPTNSTNPDESLAYELLISAAGDGPRFKRETVLRGNNLVVSESVRTGIEQFFHEKSKGELTTFLPKLTLSSILETTLGDLLKAPIGELSDKNDPMLTLRSWFQATSEVASRISDMQFLDPSPKILRNYSTKAARLGENGEGLAALIHEIQSNGNKRVLLDWLKELRPDEINDIYSLEGLSNDYMLAVKEGETEFRAPVLSEGTLRFIALAAAFFQPSMPKVLVIEEIERGLHPSRLRLLLELMRSQSRRTGTQVFATTHSPALLNWLTEEDRKTTFVCTRDPESGATKMRSLADVPNLENLIKHGTHVDELFEQGWLENVP